MNNGQTILESMCQATWYNRWLVKEFAGFLKNDILEVGCGIGNFTDYLTKFGNVWAIDINREYVEKTEMLLAGKAEVGVGDIEKGKYFFKDKKFDSIVCLNVLEHIKNDNAAIENLYKLLKTGGKLILLVPAHQFLFSEIDRALNHFRRYNKQSIQKQMENTGFEIYKIRRINFLGALGWFLAGSLLRKAIVKKLDIKIFDFVAPLFLSLENFIEPAIGTSILIVAQKKI